ncbi:hypothetical protein K458DRAFT_395803 [Lentithecium fluviatile CBS 122367]|uniref:Uncharacterized protein n=1 Tax=Lentithecium fluviatile CBS 122367 TaxID=1168545 RepID=A0A6G1IH20_9PLEO|nr:hypothetical protein K458DRAFT_395803 [Lentithecium fluviatile CBS 122367]
MQVPLAKPPVLTDIRSRDGVESVVKDLQQRWEASKMYAHLAQLFYEVVDKIPVNIDQVKEQFSDAVVEKAQRDNVLQHLASVTIAATLTEIYNKSFKTERSHSVRTLAQDLAYSATDTALLSTLPIPIETVLDPEALLSHQLLSSSHRCALPRCTRL